jgi:hypothetical protein
MKRLHLPRLHIESVNTMSDRCAIPEIFESGWRLPEKVCIVAPGSNGRGLYQEIPPDYYTIAVSKAALIPEIRASVWIMLHAQQDWYPEASASFTGIRIYGDAAARVAESELLALGCECYCFYPPPDALSPEVRPVDGFIRIGGSVSGCALQIAYNFGASDILLCGVDMSGDGYFDGTMNVQPTHGDTWGVVKNLNPLIRWMMEKRGLRIHTLSPTRLDVPFPGKAARHDP